MSDLTRDIERVKAALDAPIPERKPLKRRIVMGKKGNGEETETKKVRKLKKTAAAPAKAAKEPNGDVVTVAQLAEEAGIGAQSARVKLREANAERPGGRWEWPIGSKALKEVRKTLGLGA